MLQPIPEPDPESLPFWQACRDHHLIVQRCNACGATRYPPTRYCAQCQSVESEWIESTGRGRVYSWIVVRHPIPRELYGDQVPYVVALIDLAEGVRIASNIVGCDPNEVRAHMPVEVVFEEIRDGVVLPKFRPVS